MPSSEANRAAHAYADRLCARIPEALAARLSYSSTLTLVEFAQYVEPT